MNRIKQLREEKAMSQTELGRILNVQGAAISKYESEKIPLTSDTLCTLADYFGVSIDYLCGRIDSRYPLTNSIPQFNDIKSEFEQLLKNYRTSFSVSVDTMAAKLNISAETYKKIESGHYLPSADLIKRISDLIGHDFNYLINIGSRLNSKTTAEDNQNQYSNISIYANNFAVFATRFDELCTKHGYELDSTDTLGRMSAQDIHDVRYNRIPSVIELLTISSIFCVSVDYLLGKSDIPTSDFTDDELDLLFNYRDCISVYQKNIRERAEKLAIESIKSI